MLKKKEQLVNYWQQNQRFSARVKKKTKREEKRLDRDVRQKWMERFSWITLIKSISK
jgi:hypothetical protein